MTDTGSCLDLVFGLAHLLGKQYRPALADLQDQKLWRTDRAADYGALNHGAHRRAPKVGVDGVPGLGEAPAR